MNLLISYLKEDGRICVKLNALKDMEKLATKGAHLWSTDNVNVNFIIHNAFFYYYYCVDLHLR